MKPTQFSRREWLSTAVAGGAFLAAARSAAGMPNKDKLISNPQGGYLFIPKVNIFSSGVVADVGFEIVRVYFRRERPFPEGLSEISNHLKAAERPIQALCGLELRSGRQLAMPEFLDRAGKYFETMTKAGLVIDGRMPIARTNVAVPGTDEALRIHAFSYTRPAPRSLKDQPPNFLISGVPDVRGIGTKPEVVAANDVTAKGMEEKTAFVVDSLGETLAAFGAKWADVTGVQIYTTRDIHPLLASVIMPKLGPVGSRGIHLHHALLPVVGGDIEIDARSVRMETFI